VGQFVGRLQLIDEDEGANAEVEFVEIEEGVQNEELLFSIGADGNLTTNRVLTQGGASTLTPVTIVRDKGEPANTVKCSVVVRLFDFEHIVALTLANPYESVIDKIDLLEVVLGDILGDKDIADLYVVEVVAINETHSRVEIYAVNANNEFISAAELKSYVEAVRSDERLVRLGFDITEVEVASEEPEIIRKIPDWAVGVIVVLNSVIIIFILLLVLGVIWKRYSRLRERETQRMLNKRTGLRDFDSVADSLNEGERIETGGVVDPGRGALVYKKTTQVETVELPERGTGAQKKIKKVTSETSWLGKPEKESDTMGLVDEEEQWHDEEVEQNPLYSTKEYVSDFSNPLYSRRLSGVEGPDDTELHSRSSRASGGSGKDGGRAARGRPPSSQDTGGREYVDYLSEQPDLGKADTLF
jgi:hypothetical protein